MWAEMISLPDFLGNVLAYPIALFLFSAQIPICRQMRIERSSDQFTFLPTVLTSGTCFLWLSYGMYEGNWTVIAVNLLGIAFQVAYAICFCYYASPRQRRNKLLTIAALFVLLAALDVPMFALRPDSGRQVLGTITVIINVGMFASPIFAVRTALQSLDTSRVPVALTVASLASSLLWGAWALLVGDTFVFTPNVFGLVLCSAQLIAVAYIRRKKQQLARMGRNKSELVLGVEGQTVDDHAIDWETSIARGASTRQGYRSASGTAAAGGISIMKPRANSRAQQAIVDVTATGATPRPVEIPSQTSAKTPRLTSAVTEAVVGAVDVIVRSGSIALAKASASIPGSQLSPQGAAAIASAVGTASDGSTVAMLSPSDPRGLPTVHSEVGLDLHAHLEDEAEVMTKGLLSSSTNIKTSASATARQRDEGDDSSGGSSATLASDVGQAEPQQ